MEKEKELYEKILKITTLITEKHPELSAKLEEMPVTIPIESTPEITLEILRDYYESLEKMLKKYP